MSEPTSDVEESLVLEHHDPEGVVADPPLSLEAVLLLSVEQQLRHRGINPKGRDRMRCRSHHQQLKIQLKPIVVLTCSCTQQHHSQVLSKHQKKKVLITFVSVVVIVTYLFVTDYSEEAIFAFRQFYFNNSRSKTEMKQQKDTPLRLPPCSPANVTGYVIDASHPCNFSGGRHLSDGKWYDFSTTSFNFFAYTAFYDDRPSLFSEPRIRIIAITDNASGRKVIGLFCLLYHSSGTAYVPLEVEPKGCGPPIGLQPYVYTCPVPVGIKPLSLSIQGKVAVRSCMPVEYPAKPLVPQDFAVCVPVAYGNINPYRLIEWAEMQKILGVSLVGIYDLFIGEAGRNVSRHFANEGFFDYRKTDMIFPGGGHNVLQSATVLNDCYYRHMYDVKWIIINDIDEFIKPLKHSDLKELVSFLERTITTPNSNLSTNYVIRNSYFFSEHSPDVNISSHLTFLRYRKRSPVSEMWHRVKPIIHTMACTHMYQHACLGATKKYMKRNLIESIDPEIALTQHYRSCPLSPLACVASMKDSKLDDSILGLEDVLKRNVRKKVQEIMGQLPANWT